MHLVSARPWVTVAHIICVIWQRGRENRKLFIFPPEETAKALQGVFVCVYSWGWRCCASLLSTIQILMGSRPQEAAAIRLPAPRLELASGQACSPWSRLSIQRHFVAHCHPGRAIAVLNRQEKGLFIKQLNHRKQLKSKREKNRSCVVCFQKNRMGVVGGG